MRSKMRLEYMKFIEEFHRAYRPLTERYDHATARRSEMYYTKRPEYMKFMEEFHRAYRPLTERYDHATATVTRQAQITEKPSGMEKLNEKISLLEKSLSEVGAELDNARGQMKTLEESCELLVSGDKKSTALVAEKEPLVSQLEINLEKLSERNTYLENSLFNTNTELEASMATSKELEESCLLLIDEKSALVTEKRATELKLNTAQSELEELGKKHTDLERKYTSMMMDREPTLRLVEQLKISLASVTQKENLQIAKMKNQIHLLEEVGKKTREELEGELDKAEKFISELADKNIELNDKANFLSGKIKQMRMGTFLLLEALEVNLGGCAYDEVDLELVLHQVLVKLDNIKNAVFRAWDDNQKLRIENSVLVSLLGHFKGEVADLKALIFTLQQEFQIGNDQLSCLLKDMHKLLQSNEQLIQTVREGNLREDLFAAQVESLKGKLLNMQFVCKNLEEEKGIILDVKRSLELENSHLVFEAVALDTLSQVFKSSAQEGLVVVHQLNNDIEKLCRSNDALEEKLQIMESTLDEIQEKKRSLKVSLKTCEHELREAAEANSHSKHRFSEFSSVSFDGDTTTDSYKEDIMLDQVSSDASLLWREEELKTQPSKRGIDAEQSILKRLCPQTGSQQSGGSFKSIKDKGGQQDKDGQQGSGLKKACPKVEITAGFLLKKSEKTNRWSRRWFVLNEKTGKLGYTKWQEERHFRGVITLEECKIEEIHEVEESSLKGSKDKKANGPDSLKGSSLVFKLTSKVSYKTVLKAHSAVILKAESQSEKVEWLNKLSNIAHPIKGAINGEPWDGHSMRQSYADGSLDTIARKPDPEEELRWLTQEVSGYIEAVLNSLAANVPKAIVLCQVEKAKEDMLNLLYSSVSLQNSARIEELLQEDGNAKNIRVCCQKLSSILSKLLRQLSIHDSWAAAASNWSDSGSVIGIVV